MASGGQGVWCHRRDWRWPGARYSNYWITCSDLSSSRFQSITILWYWYRYWYHFWKSQVLILVLVSFFKLSVLVLILVLKWKILSIGIDVGIEFENLKDWYRYWYRNLVLQDEISVSFKTSRYRASMTKAYLRLDHCCGLATMMLDYGGYVRQRR